MIQRKIIFPGSLYTIKEGEKMSKKKYLIRLSEEFRSIYQDPDNLKDYYSYYLSLVNFIEKRPKYFTEEIKNAWGLPELMTIDPKEYIVSKPDISLKMEKKRMGSSVFGSVDTIAMSISSTLWDMVTIYSGKDCPITPEMELRYIKNVLDGGSESILLECSQCGWVEESTGKEYDGPFGNFFPANKKDLQGIGITQTDDQKNK